jgi:hypothetical protein
MTIESPGGKYDGVKVTTRITLSRIVQVNVNNQQIHQRTEY